MARRSRTRRFFLALVLIPLLSAALVEAGSRLADRWRGKPWDPQAARAEVEAGVAALARRGGRDERGSLPGERAVLNPRSEALVPQPYTGWDQVSAQARAADELEYFRRPEALAAYDVWVLGGSVAHRFASLGADELVETLRADPTLADRQVRIHDHASEGTKQFQPLMRLGFLLGLGHEPDAVIELDGFNEAALGWHNGKSGAHPAYPFLSYWADATGGVRTDWDIVGHLYAIRSTQDRALAWGERLLRSGLWRSSFLGHAASSRFRSLRADYVAAVEAYARHLASRPKESFNKGPRFAEDDEGILDAIVTCWEQGSVSMHGICAERGITYLHVLQPVLHLAGSKPLTKKEVDGGAADRYWIMGVLRAYPRLREAGKRIEARGIPFLDATQVFRDHPEDLYDDLCHVNQRGNEILAAAIGEALVRAEAGNAARGLRPR